MSLDWRKMYQSMFGEAPRSARNDTEIVVTEKEALRIAKEILTIPYGWYKAVWRTSKGLKFSAPLSPNTEIRWWRNGWKLLGTINGPGPDCSDLGLDPRYPPCRGVRWENANRKELIKILADDIYERPEQWIYF